MDIQEIKNRVTTVVSEHLPNPLKDTAYDKDFKEDIDSLDTVEIIMALEDEFNIDIDDTEWEDALKDKPITVTNITDLISKKLT